MPYNRRDQLKHWVRRSQRADRPCTHACCRGYRVHPKNYPVILANPTLRRARDEDLATHFVALSAIESPAARRGEAQLLREMQRRDELDERRRQHREAIEARRAAQRMERESESQRIRLEAEARTQGYLVSAEGRARGISDEEILTGREAVFVRYASPEAKEYFAEHPRPTAGYLRFGRDSSVRYSDRPTRPRRPRYPTRPRAAA